ncbi:hypothetical protein ACE01N_19915 [Saccharicrinis sp. FJH2]|uniref:hypothetical protein n=1 Tax=Saccharicrinis sp. FJH65 TaxID=3344659 RepID=UPI0035F331BF
MKTFKTSDIFKTSLIFLLILINFQGFSQAGDYMFIPENKIKKKQYREFVDQEIINEYDRIIAVYKLETDDANKLGLLQIEKAYILTNDKLIEFMKIGDRITKNTILIDKILNISLDPTLKVIEFEDITYYCKLKEEHLYDNVESYTGTFNSFDGKQFYSLLMDVWNKTNSYNRLRQIYTRFYDEKGNKIPTHSELIEKEKITELKKEIGELRQLTVSDYSNLYFINENPLIKIRYDVADSIYVVTRIVLDNLPEDLESRKVAIMNYEILIRDKHEIPYQDNRGITYVEASELETDNIEKITDFIKTE